MFRERYTRHEDVNIVFRAPSDSLRNRATDARMLRAMQRIHRDSLGAERREVWSADVLTS